MSTSVARRRTVTPKPPISSQITGAGRDLLKRVMAGIRDKHDKPFAAWCRENGRDHWRTRAALLGASRTPKAVADASAAIQAAGLNGEV